MAGGHSQRRLGRGLSALIPGGHEPERPAAEVSSGLLMVPLERLRAKQQPRIKFDEGALEELAQSIRANGILQPILVRREADHYVIIAGERRSRAARLAGLTEVPVVLREATEAQAYELALVENIQRQDLDPMEEAEGYQHLIQSYGYTQEQLAKRMGKDRATIANALRLLKLPEALRDYLVEGKLSAGHARAILSLPETHREPFAEEILQAGLSVRGAEQRARAVKHELLLAQQGEDEVEIPPPFVARSPEAVGGAQAATFSRATQEAQLQAALGMPVRIRFRAGRGRVEIHFEGDDEFQDLADHLLTIGAIPKKERKG